LNNPNGLIIFFWMSLVGQEFDGRPSHISLGKCTSDTMVDIVMDLTEVVVYWMVGGLGGHQTDTELSSRKGIVTMFWQLPFGHGLDDPPDSLLGLGSS
jgi:hypothetical protein